MTVDLDPGAYPIFLRGDYLNREADEQNDLVLSSGTSYRHRLYDMDPAAIWRGTTASDASTETIIAGIWDPGVQTAKDIDFIALLGTNFKNFLIDLSVNNGVTYAAANYTITDNANPYYLKNVATAVSADKIKVTGQTTQTADDYKELGALIVGSVLLQAPIGLTTYKQRATRVKDKSVRLHNNTVRRSYVYRSDASIGLWGALCGFAGLTETEADALEAVLLGVRPFVFAPRPGDQPWLWKYCHTVPGSYTRDYAVKSTSGGLAVSFELEEIGGA